MILNKLIMKRIILLIGLVSIFLQAKAGENVINLRHHIPEYSYAVTTIHAQAIDYNNKIESFNFRKNPYLLYPGKNTEMLIIWQLDGNTNCTLTWGETKNSLDNSITTTEEDGDHIHKILLTSLEPNTHYYYKVLISDDNYKYGNFITGKNDDAKNISFYAYGDTRNHPEKHDIVAQQVMNSIANDPSSQTFIVTTGDYVDNGDSESAWDSQFFNKNYPNIQEMLANLPYLAAMGNHEKQGVLFTKYFPYPMFEDRRYYSFDNGPVHIVIVDQYTDYTKGSKQHNWLENDLATNNKKWKIVLLHEPGWSARYHPNNVDVQNIIQPLCVKYGVQFVLTGHNHYYARAVVDNVYHITTGGGGAPLSNPKPNSDKIVIYDKSYHFCKLDIKDEVLSFSAIRSDGTSIETFDYPFKPLSNESNDLSIESDFKVYSSNNSIIIEKSINQKANVEVFDLWGKSIKQKQILYKENIIQLNNNGIYFLRITRKGYLLFLRLYFNLTH